MHTHTVEDTYTAGTRAWCYETSSVDMKHLRFKVRDYSTPQAPHTSHWLGPTPEARQGRLKKGVKTRGVGPPEGVHGAATRAARPPVSAYWSRGVRPSRTWRAQWPCSCPCPGRQPPRGVCRWRLCTRCGHELCPLPSAPLTQGALEVAGTVSPACAGADPLRDARHCGWMCGPQRQPPPPAASPTRMLAAAQQPPWVFEAARNRRLPATAWPQGSTPPPSGAEWRASGD